MLISVFKGFVLPRFYWRGSWSGRPGKYCMESVKRLFTIGKLSLHLTSYHRYSRNKYKYEALKLMREHFDLRREVRRDYGWPWTVMWSCYSMQDGSYVGVPERAIRYLRLGIRRFYTKEDGKTSCTGYSPESGKWYGWSHRAIYGFEIGYVVKGGSIVRGNGWIKGCPQYEESEKLKPPMGFVAETRYDCRYLAERFAEAVG